MTVAIDSSPITTALAAAYGRLRESNFIDGLWNRRLDMWGSDPAVQGVVANRLGWLDAIDLVTPQIARVRAFADDIRASDFTDIVLLGMGGSSLAPEVLRRVGPVASDGPRFAVLDSVDPDAVSAAMARATTTLFILASKSGTTIEPNSMAADAQRRLRDEGVDDIGSRFVAITDEGTDLHRRAIEQGYRDVFINPADIGGRYSALSLFGIVPAALMGIDIEALLASARAMADECRQADPKTNPGLMLGAAMAAGALEGHDKLTLQMPEYLQPFGLWVEQLVAESTGKRGKGVVPIVGETADTPRGDDRFVVTLTLPHATDLGAEFFRWEVATAAAGWLLGINPFDEPNVKQAKDATRGLLEEYTVRGRLPEREAHASFDGCTFTLSAAAEHGLNGAPAERFLGLLGSNDYLGVLLYLPPDDERLDQDLRRLRDAVATQARVATMIGYGPRYLHSTGQLHKGGPNNGVFIVLTAAPADDFPVPGESYSFGVLQMAQALGDFQSLEQCGRRALHVHLPNRGVDLLRLTLNRLM